MNTRRDELDRIDEDTDSSSSEPHREVFDTEMGEYDPEENEGYCLTCSGSGEAGWSGSICPKCHGSGSSYKPKKEEEYD